MLSDIAFRTTTRRSSSDSGKANVVLLIAGVIALILAPIASKLIQLAISRRREYLADATAVSFTRNPDALVSALERITADPNELESANSATAHMFFASPFKGDLSKKVSGLMSTHPPVEERIKAIRELK
jgi:heat shock protein HtpX